MAYATPGLGAGKKNGVRVAVLACALTPALIACTTACTGSPMAGRLTVDEADAGTDGTVDRPDTGAADTSSRDALLDSVDAPNSNQEPPDFDGSCPMADGGASGSPMTVTGRVYGVNGSPVFDETVRIQGMSTVTAADGSFTLAGVQPPYDVTLDGNLGINTYVGLTRADPTLLGPGEAFGVEPLRVASLAASVPVDDAGEPTTWFVLDATQASSGGTLDIETAYSGGAARLSAEWSSQDASAPATLLAFSASYLGSGGLRQITGVSTSSITLDDGKYTSDSLVLSPPTTATTLSGSITLPTGYTPGYMQVGLAHGIIGDSAGAFVTRDSPSGQTFSYATFTSDLSWVLNYSAKSPGGGQIVSATVAGLHGDEPAVAVNLPACDMQQVSPARGSTTPSSCVGLSWTAATTPSVYVVTVQLPGPSYQLVTDQSSVQIPFPLPAGTYSWQVRAISPATTVDAFAGSLATVAALAPGQLVVSHTECETITALGSFSFSVP